MSLFFKDATATFKQDESPKAWRKRGLNEFTLDLKPINHSQIESPHLNPHRQRWLSRIQDADGKPPKHKGFQSLNKPDLSGSRNKLAQSVRVNDFLFVASNCFFCFTVFFPPVQTCSPLKKLSMKGFYVLLLKKNWGNFTFCLKKN